MAYVKLEMYTITRDPELIDQLIIDLCTNGMDDSKARRLVFYPPKMSLIRWSRYLTSSQMQKYLVKCTKDTPNEIEDLGI